MKHLQFICLKWGNKYPAHYVNRLFRMIERFTNTPFKLYCMTDDEQGLIEQVSTLPIIDDSLTGWWHKLSIFQEDLHGLSGPLLFLDLDVVITQDLSPLFEYKKGEFVIIRDLGTGGYNSSVFRLEAGTMADIWQSFQQANKDIISRLHGDQDWITQQINNAITWPCDWVVSYKKQCHSRIRPSYGKIGKYLRSNGWCLPKDVAVLPENAKIVQFHGKPDPEDVLEKPYGLYKAAPWIKDYWLIE